MPSFELNRNLVPEQTRAVIADWDDTIVGTIDAKVRQHIMVAAKHYGITLNRNEMLKDWGRPLHELIAKWYQIDPADEAAFQAVVATVLSYSHEFLKQPFPGAREALDAIKSESLPLGIVTGSPRNDIYHDFGVLEVDPSYFDYFQTSDDTLVHKPNPLVFAPAVQWLENHGITPQETLYVGDTLNDMLAARGVGFEFLGVETSAVDMPTFYAADALSIRSLGDLIKQRA
jgi:phosphoglycolate phosphatase-like HAD superfamily hydrolase